MKDGLLVVSWVVLSVGMLAALSVALLVEKLDVVLVGQRVV
jgi:hypothetical protein